MTETFGSASAAAAPTAFIAAAFQSERAAEALHTFYTGRFARCESVVRRAVDRGEAPSGTDAASVVRAVSAPLFFRALITREPIDTPLADQTATAVATAVRAGAYLPDRR
ncbi:TetR/AcrR family transcriptional regulator C-terminal ligand-binding domain-containing protein [Streptomyces malaysiensis subsp. malaysiensis]|nr:TetR/AcrR family transcriptional regulator C-terminal ligand-binding domain-containing protein [Streptomyces sp. HNM0561]